MRSPSVSVLAKLLAFVSLRLLLQQLHASLCASLASVPVVG